MRRSQSSVKAYPQFREFRRPKGWSQAKLAEMANVSKKVIENMERGKGGTSLTIAKKVAEALDVPIEDLFDFWESTNTSMEPDRAVSRE